MLLSKRLIGCGLQRPPAFGSAKKWELMLREIYCESVRTHGVAPGAFRVRELMADRCGAKLASKCKRTPILMEQGR